MVPVRDQNRRIVMATKKMIRDVDGILFATEIRFIITTRTINSLKLRVSLLDPALVFALIYDDV